MAVGDRLQIADKPTLDLTKADTTEILERIGDTGGGTGDSVIEMLQILLNTPKIIKSIQYGTAVLNWGGGATTITISSVNPQKCFVLLNGSAIAARNNEDAVTTYDPYITAFSSDSISIERSSSYSNQSFGTNGKVSYQIIEYV